MSTTKSNRIHQFHQVDNRTAAGLLIGHASKQDSKQNDSKKDNKGEEKSEVRHAAECIWYSVKFQTGTEPVLCL